MGCTRITLTSELQARLAKGHNHVLEPVASRYADALAGAIAIRSSANDMLTVLAANLGFVKSPLAPAMAAMVVPRKSMGGPNLDIALAWNVQKRFGGEILMHEGTTGG